MSDFVVGIPQSFTQERLAEMALDVALRFIQATLGVTSGDFAAQHFAGGEEREIGNSLSPSDQHDAAAVEIFRQYIAAESDAKTMMRSNYYTQADAAERAFITKHKLYHKTMDEIRALMVTATVDEHAMDPDDPDDAIMLAMSGIVPLDEPGLITEQSMKTRTGMGSEFPTFTRKLTAEEVAERDRGFTGSSARMRQPIPRFYGDHEDE